MCCVKLQSFIQSCLWLECNGSVWKKQKGACTTVVAIVKCLGLILWWGAQQMCLLNNKNPYSVLCGQTGPCCKAWVMVLFYVWLVVFVFFMICDWLHANVWVVALGVVCAVGVIFLYGCDWWRMNQHTFLVLGENKILMSYQNRKSVRLSFMIWSTVFWPCFAWQGYPCFILLYMSEI